MLPFMEKPLNRYENAPTICVSIFAPLNDDAPGAVSAGPFGLRERSYPGTLLPSPHLAIAVVSGAKLGRVV